MTFQVGQRSGAFRMGGGGMVGITTGCPAGQARQNGCATCPRGVLRLEHQQRGPLAECHPGTLGIKRTATGSVHQQQGMKPAPGHARQRIGTTGEHDIRFTGHDQVRRSGDGQRAGGAGGGNGEAGAEQAEVIGHDFDGGRRVYEPMVGRAHHDHLCCISCAKVIEFEEEAIERLQEAVVARYKFTPVYHSHKIFGYCEACAPRGKRR